VGSEKVLENLSWGSWKNPGFFVSKRVHAIYGHTSHCIWSCSLPSGIATDGSVPRHRRQRGRGLFSPPKIWENILWQIFRNFSVFFFWQTSLKFGHFVNFSFVYFPAKMPCPKSWLGFYTYGHVPTTPHL